MGKNRPRHPLPFSGSTAFTTVEVLVTLVIFGVVLVGLYSGISSGLGFVQLTRENLRATQIMEEKMETIRLYRWNQINQPGFIPTNFVERFCPFLAQSTSGLTFTGTLEVAAAPLTEYYSDDLRQVNITVAWKSGNVLRQRHMTSFVARYGLQNYVY